MLSKHINSLQALIFHQILSLLLKSHYNGKALQKYSKVLRGRRPYSLDLILPEP